MGASMNEVSWSPSSNLQSVMEVSFLYFESPVGVTVRSHTKHHVLFGRKAKKKLHFEKSHVRISAGSWSFIFCSPLWKSKRIDHIEYVWGCIFLTFFPLSRHEQGHDCRTLFSHCPQKSACQGSSYGSVDRGSRALGSDPSPATSCLFHFVIQHVFVCFLDMGHTHLAEWVWLL